MDHKLVNCETSEIYVPHKFVCIWQLHVCINYVIKTKYVTGFAKTDRIVTTVEIQFIV